MSVIETKELTKDFGNRKGIFNVDIAVKEGEVYGFLGPNGAGKTTTIRNLMGFIRPDHGSCSILGMDCFKEAAHIKENLGYLAGEIAFLDDLSGRQMIDFIADLQGIKDRSRITQLIDMFELDPRGRIRKMSKGMKQKIGIVTAFMGNPQVAILDEPTSGLDPLMQNRFVELILEEKKKGTTILMSSHIFEEIERTCDRTAIIRQGEIVAIEDMESMAKKKKKNILLTFYNREDKQRFERENAALLHRREGEGREGLQTMIAVKDDYQALFGKLSAYRIQDIDIRTQSLEEIFLHYYGREEN